MSYITSTPNNRLRECTISDDRWAGKHEGRIDHMIYFTFSHSLEVLFPSCYAVSTFSATPEVPSGTMVRGKVMSSEMTDVDRPRSH